MNLENELRNITLGDSTIHEYFEKIKKTTDLLEGLGEKMKYCTVVLHALNGLPSKYDTVAGVIRFSKPIPTLSEMRSMLLVEGTRINNSRLTVQSHKNHSSAPSLLQAATSSPLPTHGGGGSSYCGNSTLRVGGHDNYRRHQQGPPFAIGPPPQTNQYGWVYIPSPASDHHSWTMYGQNQHPWANSHSFL
ncbi:hypothetical protein Lser_V15G42824 [Lactuca serriola]